MYIVDVYAHVINVASVTLGKRKVMESLKLFPPILKHARIMFNPHRWLKTLSPTFPCITPNSFRYLTTESKPEIEVHVREKIDITKSVIPKIKRPPFAKNLFLGVFDQELLAFPYELQMEQLKELEEIVKKINDLFVEKVNSEKIDQENEIPLEVLQDLKDLGLFGRLVPSQFGGLELSFTAFSRINEVLGLDWSIYTILAAHELLGIQTILVAGNEAQKAKYLPDLSSGKLTATFCCTEPNSGSDIDCIQTKAEISEDGKSYNLNGTKIWVTNADLADTFIVVAKSFVRNPEGNEELLTLFLVDKNSEGIHIEQAYDKTNLCGAKAYTVHFKDTKVPVENVLCEKGQVAQILLKVLHTCRFGMGGFTCGILKELLNITTEYVINTVRYEKPLSEFQLIKERLGKVASRIYAMESTAYFTAGLLDTTEDPDCALETSIVKIFSLEGTLYCLKELRNIMGAQSLLKVQPFERLYRDCQGLIMFEGTSDIVRIYISLLGCHYFGKRRNEDISRKLRNTLFNPMFAFSKMMESYNIQRNKIKYTQDLAGFVHNSLWQSANGLEECVVKLGFCTQFVLTAYGQDTTEYEVDLCRLANIVIEIYAMAATLSRASRSYCIGLKNSTHEIKTATAICIDGCRRVNQLFDEILNGRFKNNDANYQEIANIIIMNKGYFPEHPLQRSY